MAAPKPSAFAVLVTTYLKRIAHAAEAPGASPELSLRPALAEFLEQTIKLQKKDAALHLSHEALADGDEVAQRPSRAHPHRPHRNPPPHGSH